jgi:hypothetical protein
MSHEWEMMQGELFSQSKPGGKTSLKERLKLKRFRKFSIELSYELLTVVAIISIFSLGLSYSFGVEHGRKALSRLSPLTNKPEVTVEQSLPEASPAVQKKTPEQVIQAEPVVLASTRSQYTIQLVTYSQAAKDFAKHELETLKENGYTPFLRESGPYFALCVGEYPDSKSAQKTLTKFKKSKSYHDAFLRKLK